MSGTLNLFEYIETNSIEAIKLAVNEGANFQVQDCNNFTPLHYAAKSNNRLQCMKELLKSSNVNINSLSSHGDTPVAISCQTNSDKALEILIEHGANVNIGNTMNISPLHVACRIGNLKIIQLLIEAGAHVNERDVNGWTPLHNTAMNGSIEVCEYMLEHGADVTAEGFSTPLPLHIACQNGSLRLVELFLNCMKNKMGSNPLNVISNGETALIAAMSSHSEAVVKVKYLIDNGADVNITNDKDLLPLHAAASKVNFEIFDLIKKNTKHEYILKYCTFPAPHGIKGTNRSILCNALFTQNINFIEKIMKSGLPDNVLNCPIILPLNALLIQNIDDDESPDKKLSLFTPVCFHIYYIFHYDYDSNISLNILKLLIDNNVCLNETFNNIPTLHVFGQIEMCLRCPFSEFIKFQTINMLLERKEDPDEGSIEMPTKLIRGAFKLSSTEIIMLLIIASNVVEPEDILHWIAQQNTTFIGVGLTQHLVYSLLLLSPYYPMTYSKYNYFISLPDNSYNKSITTKISNIYIQPIRSLESYCRSVIRRQLHCETRQNPKKFTEKINSLPIPKTLISYMNYNEVQFIVNESEETVNFHIPFNNSQSI